MCFSVHRSERKHETREQEQGKEGEGMEERDRERREREGEGERPSSVGGAHHIALIFLSFCQPVPG